MQDKHKSWGGREPYKSQARQFNSLASLLNSLEVDSAYSYSVTGSILHFGDAPEGEHRVVIYKFVEDRFGGSFMKNKLLTWDEAILRLKQFLERSTHNITIAERWLKLMGEREGAIQEPVAPVVETCEGECRRV